MLELLQNIINETIINNQSMAGNLESSVVDIDSISCFAIQYSWTSFSGDGNELITTYASNDNQVWTQIDSFIPSDITDSTILNIEKAGYRHVRVNYTAGSSSGTLKVTISGKVI